MKIFNTLPALLLSGLMMLCWLTLFIGGIVGASFGLTFHLSPVAIGGLSALLACGDWTWRAMRGVGTDNIGV